MTTEIDPRVPPCIQKELEKLDKQRTEAFSLCAVADQAHAIASRFPEMNIEVSVVRWTARDPFVCLRMDIGGFDELLPLFRAMATNGLHTDKEHPYDDCLDVDRRTYNFGDAHKTFGMDNHRLRVMAFIRKENAKCQKIQVGTKEEPVYKWVCEPAEV